MLVRLQKKNGRLASNSSVLRLGEPSASIDPPTEAETQNQSGHTVFVIKWQPPAQRRGTSEMRLAPATIQRQKRSSTRAWQSWKWQS